MTLDPRATDDDVAAYAVARALAKTPDVHAAPMLTFCPGRHKHVGVLAWVRGGAGAIFVRCDRHWWAWRMTASIAGQLGGLNTEDSGPVRMMEFALSEPGSAELWELFRGARIMQGERDAPRLARVLRRWGAGGE